MRFRGFFDNLEEFFDGINNWIDDVKDSILKKRTRYVLKEIKEIKARPTPPSVAEKGISARGLDMIRKHEGLRLKAYMPTPNDVPTIGYGHTKGVKMGDVITEAQAIQFLKEDIAWVERAIDRYVKVPLNQNQYDALASWVFNLGATNFLKSTMLKRLNEGNYNAVPSEMKRWNKQKGKVLAGLTRRRAEEAALFAA